MGIRVVRALLAAICLVLAPAAQATSERIIISQASDGSILVTLTGTTDCVGETTVPVSNFTITGSNVAITSDFANPGPPCQVSPTPVFYSATVNIGHVADGTYLVVWSFVLTPPGTTAFASFSADFMIAGGALFHIIPPNPSPADDVTIITQFSGCIADAGMARSGFTFTGHITYDSACFATPPGGNYAFPVGKLPAGIYDVAITYSTQGSSGSTNVTGTFQVFAAYEAPTLQPVGLGILAVLLYVVAISRFARR